MKIDRLVSIILILLEKKRIGAQELSELFGVSQRTIYRDIDSINLAGIPIFSTSGVGGGFEILEQYKIDKKIFSTSDLTTLLIGLSSLSNMIRGDELIHALAKVKSFIPSETAQEIELKANQICIDLNPWFSNLNIQSCLSTIKTALDENKVLSFEYIDHHGNRTQRTVEPYQLILKNSHWYWFGYCYTRADFRLFRLSRMTKLTLLEQTFKPRNYQNPELTVPESIKNKQIRIKLCIDESIMDRVLDFCSIENFIPHGDHKFIVSFPFIENDYYYDMLISFGSKCKCLEPEHIRLEIKNKINSLAAVYE